MVSEPTLYLNDDEVASVLEAVEADAVLSALVNLLPADTVVAVEGTSIASEVATFLSSHAAVRVRKIRPHTIYPEPQVFHVPLGALQGLRRLADRHAIPEVLDHLTAYADDAVLVEATDLGDCTVRVSRVLPRETRERLIEMLSERDT